MIRKLILAALAFSLSACFDLNQSFVVDEDGSGTYEIQLITEPWSGKDGTDEDFCEDVFEGPRPANLNSKLNRRLEGQDVVCTLTIDGSLEGLAKLNPLGAREEGEPNFVTIVPLGNDSYRLANEWHFEPSSEPNKEGNPEDEGRALSWTVTAPHFLTTNGMISKDGKSVHWELPLSEEPDNGVVEFFVEFSLVE